MKDKTYKNFIKEENTIVKDKKISSYKEQKNEITKLTKKSKKKYITMSTFQKITSI